MNGTCWKTNINPEQFAELEKAAVEFIPIKPIEGQSGGVLDVVAVAGGVATVCAPARSELATVFFAGVGAMIVPVMVLSVVMGLNGLQTMLEGKRRGGRKSRKSAVRTKRRSGSRTRRRTKRRSGSRTKRR
jgi:hypothetical protein